jgi:pimeloyl-ACP methyl ester carboxylesterase
MGEPRDEPREEHRRIPSHRAGLSLFLRYLPPPREARPAEVVLYVHGGTFPSGLSIAHRSDGRSWRDELASAGFHCWELDFHGFGGLSDPYPEMAEPTENHAPLGRADDASRQLELAVRYIRARHSVEGISLIAHSWGSIVSGRFAGRCPELVERLVFFGPIAWRAPRGERQRLPAWRFVSLKDQRDRFVADVPPGEPPVLSKRHFDQWGEAYLDTDPESRTRTPAAVTTPSGAFQDIYDAWAGELAYDPGLVRAPVVIIRGEWDRMSSEEDAEWLFNALKASRLRRIVTIGRGTHLLHLEENRFALYRAAQSFLAGNEVAAGVEQAAA